MTLGDFVAYLLNAASVNDALDSGLSRCSTSIQARTIKSY